MNPACLIITAYLLNIIFCTHTNNDIPREEEAFCHLSGGRLIVTSVRSNLYSKCTDEEVLKAEDNLALILRSPKELIKYAKLESIPIPVLDILTLNLPEAVDLRELKLSVLHTSGEKFYEFIQSLPPQLEVLTLKCVSFPESSVEQNFPFPSNLNKINVIVCSFNDVIEPFTQGLLSIPNLKEIQDTKGHLVVAILKRYNEKSLAKIESIRTNLEGPFKANHFPEISKLLHLNTLILECYEYLEVGDNFLNLIFHSHKALEWIFLESMFNCQSEIFAAIEQFLYHKPCHIEVEVKEFGKYRILHAISLEIHELKKIITIFSHNIGTVPPEKFRQIILPYEREKLFGCDTSNEITAKKAFEKITKLLKWNHLIFNIKQKE